MTKQTDEHYHDDLNLAIEEAWALLREGSTDRHSPLHTPVVGTITSDNEISQRVMVLREIDSAQRMLRFNTDVRASKVSDLRENDAISVVGYHAAAKVQLRLSGTASVIDSGEAVNNAWAEASLYAKRCYLANPAPGSNVSEPISGLDPYMEGRKPTEDEVLPARQNFSVLLARIDRIEWLYLAHTGHRRAKFDWNDASGCWDGQWLVP